MSTKRGYLAIVYSQMITAWMIKKKYSTDSTVITIKSSPQIRALLTAWLAPNRHRLCERHNALITVIAKHPVYKVAASPLMLWCPLPLSSHSTLVVFVFAEGARYNYQMLAAVSISPLSLRYLIPVSIWTSHLSLLKQLPLMEGSHASQFEPY